MIIRNKIILIASVVLLVLGTGIFWYTRSRKNIVPEQKVIDQTEIEKAKRAAELNNLNNALDQIRLVDKDLDGLSDIDEGKLGTDPQKSDTDGDGLLDNDEINIHKTNPLKADTDGDGKKDGYEVRHGLNPLKK